MTKTTIELPYAVGDEVWVVYNEIVHKTEVNRIQVNIDTDSSLVMYFVPISYSSIDVAIFSHSIFPTKAEAIAKLQEVME